MISHTEYVIYTFNWILPNRTQKSVDDLYIYIYIYNDVFLLPFTSKTTKNSLYSTRPNVTK